jgi:hypothetical protein
METATANEQQSAPARRARNSFPKGVSGNPKGAPDVKRLAAALYAELAPSFEPLDPVEQMLLLQAATLSVRARMKSTAAASAARMSMEARKTIESLRKARAQKSPRPKARPAAASGGDDAFEAHLAELAARGDVRATRQPASETDAPASSAEAARGAPASASLITVISEPPPDMAHEVADDTGGDA